MTICLSFLLAVSLHVAFFSLPFLTDAPKLKVSEIRLELLYTEAQKATAPLPGQVRTSVPEKPISSLKPAPDNEPVKQFVPSVQGQKAAEPAPKSFERALPNARKSLAQMDEGERQRLARSLLSQQFLSETSITDELFGKTPDTQQTVDVATFRFPIKPSMMTMLDKPMPDLPFAYQEGLVHFAYAPGMKGDLQRFWDVITPEIAFRTKYGTEVRCIWLLIIGGCAWK